MIPRAERYTPEQRAMFQRALEYLNGTTDSIQHDIDIFNETNPKGVVAHYTLRPGMWGILMGLKPADERRKVVDTIDLGSLLGLLPQGELDLRPLDKEIRAYQVVVMNPSELEQLMMLGDAIATLYDLTVRSDPLHTYQYKSTTHGPTRGILCAAYSVKPRFEEFY